MDTIQGKAIIDTQSKTINAQFSATMTGDYMPNDGFTQKQLEQLGLLIKPINERLTNIENRLDVIEQDIKVLKEDMVEVKKEIKAIKECPTIKKELENK